MDNELPGSNQRTFRLESPRGLDYYSMSRCITAESNQSLAEELGLSKYAFNEYTNDRMTLGLPAQPYEHIYLLAHGWTGTGEIFSGVPTDRGESIVEEILRRDVNARVITIDGNGFGQSEFTVSGSRETALYCNPEMYARQIDYLLKNTYGISGYTQGNVALLGHSMGGAAMEWLAKYGYSNRVAAAPAALSTRHGSSELRRKDLGLGVSQMTLMSPILRTAAIVYQSLSGSIAASDLAGSLGTEILTQVYDRGLANFLMGKNKPGQSQIDTHQIRHENLMELHRQQLIEKRTLSAQAIAQLHIHRLNFAEWDDDQLKNLILNTRIVAGRDDKLVTPFDVVETIRDAVLTIKDRDDASGNTLLDSSERDQVEHIFEQFLPINTPADQIEGYSPDSVTQKITMIENAGHYASLYDGATVDALVGCFGLPPENSRLPGSSSYYGSSRSA